MRATPKTALVLALAALPAVASADILTIWVGGKGDYVGGSGDVYKTFDSSFGGGVEAGIEVLGIDLWADFLPMGNSQYLSTVNLGFDVTLGSPLRFTVGLFTGPMFFFFPENQAETLTFTASQRQTLLENGVDVDKIEREYNKLVDDESDLSRVAAGWNILRGQAELEFELAPVLFIGIGGDIGYHYIISGEDVAAGAKNHAIDELVKEENLQKAIADLIRDATGARDVDQDNLNGINYNVGLFLRLEL